MMSLLQYMRAAKPGAMAAVLVLVLQLSVAVPGQWVDSTTGVHAFLTFDYDVLKDVGASNLTAHAKYYDYVWGANPSDIPLWKQGNKDIVMSMYMPYSRDPGCTSPAAGDDEAAARNLTTAAIAAARRNGNPPPGKPPHPNNIEWWLAHHPDWIVYECDKTTIAYDEDDCNVPLDISNPAVIEWQQKFVRQAAAAGYDAMACDNYQPTGYGAGCGIYSNGKWVQKYTGKPGDMQLEHDVIDWMAQFVKLAHTVQSKSGRPMMVIPNMCGIPTNDSAWQNPDGVLNEASIASRGGEAAFVEAVEYALKIQAAGKAYYSLNQYGGTNASTLDRSIRQWVVAQHLMSKNQASGVYLSTEQGYGHLMPTEAWPEFTCPVGKAVGPMAKEQGAYFRNYTTGLAVSNPTNVSVTVDLDPAFTYVDCYGTAVQPARLALPPESGLVLMRKSTEQARIESN